MLSRRERGSGPVKIQAELQQRGIDNALISRYLDFRDPDWMELAEPARAAVERDLPDAAPEVRARACEQNAIGVSLQNLMTFHWVRERVESGQLALHGWYFDIEQGQLLQYNNTSRQFENL